MWDWAIWGAVFGGGVAILAALALLGRRALGAWRAFKEARRSVFQSLDELVTKGEETAAKASAAGDTAELQESVARLRLSLARLTVLRDALGEAQEVVGRVTVFLPGK